MTDLRCVSGPEGGAEQSIGYRSGAPRSGSEEGRGRNSFPGPREALGDFAQVSSLHSGDLQVIPLSDSFTCITARVSLVPPSCLSLALSHAV